eukprot:6466445-Pyramimonas_sp.AAC.1
MSMSAMTAASVTASRLAVGVATYSTRTILSPLVRARARRFSALQSSTPIELRMCPPVVALTPITAMSAPNIDPENTCPHFARMPMSRAIHSRSPLEAQCRDARDEEPRVPAQNLEVAKAK